MDDALFPPIEPYATGRLSVGHGHQLYWEQSGNANGQPVLFLHGGPGSGANSGHRRFFDPAHYRIVIFDQRGAGRSAPRASIVENTTQRLVEDIETLRRHLGIARWLVFGGSWGSTLALAYGEAHPECCLGFVLRGIFLGTASEIDWFLHGIEKIFPEVWARFSGFLPESERGDILANYHRRLIDEDPEIHRAAARAWSSYEGACSTLLPSSQTVSAFSEERVSLGLARMEAHYMVNQMFLGPDQLIHELPGISRLPAIIVQGRYDVICPATAAYRLHTNWPGSELHMIPNAGHSAMEAGTRGALVAATEKMKGILSRA